MTIREVMARIRRMGSSRGFGIQSPSDYSFVCDIVNCRHTYYAYSDLKNTITGISGKERRKAELLFRITNFLQPDVTVNLGMEQWYETYISSACKRTRIYSGNDTHRHQEGGEEGDRRLLLISCKLPYDGQIYGRYMTDGTILIADGINTDNKARRQWQRIAGDSRSTLVFDLYDIGIVIADTKRSKVTYKINY